jgi:hypothetical protein
VPASVHRTEADSGIRVYRSQPPQFAAPGEPDRELERVLVLSLCTRLVDHAVPSHVVCHRVGFVDRHRAGLLDVQVLAGLCRPHRHQPVPPVAGRDQQRVDVWPCKDLCRIAVHFAVVVLVIAVDRALYHFASILANVGDADKPHSLIAEQHPEVCHSPIADTDATDDDLVDWSVVAHHYRSELAGTRCGDLRHGRRRRGCSRRCGHDLPEFSPSHFSPILCHCSS